jgi:trk system potassium uptake protein TrkA
VKAKKVLVVGLGHFGSALAAELWDTNCELIVIDRDPEAVDRHKQHAAAAFVADATDPGVLENVGAQDVDVAVVTSGEDFEATVLCVSQLVELGVKTIFARAANARQAHVLRAVGATRAVQVEDEMGRRIAVQVLNPVATELMDFATHFRVVPWVAVPPFVGQSLAEARFRRFELNVLGYFRKDPGSKEEKPRMRFVADDYRIEAGDTLLLVGDEDHIEGFLASLPN